MRERLSNPRSLLDEARLAIRRAIKRHAGAEGIGRYVTLTPLPRALHSFLMFEKEFDALEQRCDDNNDDPGGGGGDNDDDDRAATTTKNSDYIDGFITRTIPLDDGADDEPDCHMNGRFLFDDSDGDAYAPELDNYWGDFDTDDDSYNDDDYESDRSWHTDSDWKTDDEHEGGDGGTD